MIETIDFLKKNIEKNTTLVVAVSGGPDSMVLLDILNKMKHEVCFKLVCAHVNHGLRDESLAEEKMVAEYCAENGIIFEKMTIGSYNTSSIENEARSKRYEFFENCVKKCQSKYLLTAHHGDDQIETILMRIVRGSSLKGYAGIRAITHKNGYDILRPMLGNTKDEILKYATENNIDYAIDKTNMEDIYTRNRYRKYILPVLKKEDENVHKKFEKFSLTLMMYQDYVNKIVEDKFDDLVIDNVINVSKFKNEDILIQINIINMLLKKTYGSNISKIGDKHTLLIMEIINGSKNAEISLPDSMVAIKSYNKFKIRKNFEIEEYKVELSKEVILPNNHKVVMLGDTLDNSNYVCRLNTNELSMPLYIRNRKNGDKMAVLGLNGRKKLKNIFIDDKVDKDVRDNYPVLVDSNDEILWIPGVKKSKFNKQKEEKYDIILKYY